MFLKYSERQNIYEVTREHFIFEWYCDSYGDLMWAEKMRNFEFSKNDLELIYIQSRHVPICFESSASLRRYIHLTREWLIMWLLPYELLGREPGWRFTARRHTGAVAASCRFWGSARNGIFCIFLGDASYSGTLTQAQVSKILVELSECCSGLV